MPQPKSILGDNNRASPPPKTLLNPALGILQSFVRPGCAGARNCRPNSCQILARKTRKTRQNPRYPLLRFTRFPQNSRFCPRQNCPSRTAATASSAGTESSARQPFAIVRSEFHSQGKYLQTPQVDTGNPARLTPAARPSSASSGVSRSSGLSRLAVVAEFSGLAVSSEQSELFACERREWMIYTAPQTVLCLERGAQRESTRNLVSFEPSTSTLLNRRRQGEKQIFGISSTEFAPPA